MAKHEVVIHENRGATKEAAPYTGVYIARETVREDGYVAGLAAKSGLPAVQVQAILNGSFDVVAELEKESLVRIHTDLGTIEGVLTGSFDTADAAFDPRKNALTLALRLDDGIRLALADTVPAIVADENLTKLRVDNVMDLATPRPYNLIHGQGVFRVAGFNMVHEDEGAAVYLQDAKGVTYPVANDRAVSKQLFEAHTSELLEPGDYRLVVKSRAGDAEGPLQTSFRKVKYLKVAPKVTIEKVRNDNDATQPGDRMTGATNTFTVFGKGLASGGTLPDVTVEAKTETGEWTDLSAGLTRTGDADAIRVELDGLPFSEDSYSRFRVTVANAAGTASHEGALD